MRKNILRTAIIASILMSTSASALMCSQFERVGSQAFEISSSKNSAELTPSSASLSVTEYGGMSFYMASCSDADGTTVEVTTHKRANMETVETNQWTVYTKLNLCNENAYEESPVTLKGDFGARLTVTSKKNREGTYLFKGKTANGKHLTLFADKSAAIY
jgi:hypothetical protein